MQLDKTTSSNVLDLTLSLSERAHHVCELARDQEEAGNFEAARQLLSDFWQRVGERPNLEGLDVAARADVLLRSGTLTGWIGSAQRISGAQAIAKDLISESAGLFEEQSLPERVAEARIDLGVCYWRAGALDEARITFDAAL